LADAGFGFIVGSRITEAPYDLAKNWDVVDRARRLAGLKGYVTNIARPPR
jgi:hypothetical protein